MMSKFTFIVFFLFLSIFSVAQNTESYLNCAFDSLHSSKIQHDRSYFENIFKSESKYVNYLANTCEYQGNSFTLPVVFHIIHQNGAENISDAQIRDALIHLNESFANSGYYDPATGVNTDVQFCLAKRDPAGNLANGITRTFSSLTNLDADIDDSNLKDLSRWDPTSYINIWVVKEICRGSSCSVAGYAYLPAAHGRDFDGIVLEADYVGTSRSKTTVLTHEMGHYLGLYHTFDGGCRNNDCQQDGDKVCDTPPDNTTAYTACEGSMNSCDSDEDDNSANNPFRSAGLGGLGDQDDLIANYMDYSQLSCYNLFTQGQKDRMHFFINTVRRSLLNSLACETPCDDLVQASFSVTDTEIDLGTSLSFSNNSLNADSYNWYINDSLFSTNVNPSYTFDREGYYNIILEGISIDTVRCGNDYDTIEIIVTCPTNSGFHITTDDLRVSAMNNSQNHSSSHWSLRDQNGQELNTANTEDFSYELTEAGWYQLCLQVESISCSSRKCEYFYLNNNTLNKACLKSTSKIIYNEAVDYIDIKMVKSSDQSIYISGVKDNEYFISKFSTSGEVIWSKTLPLFQSESGQRRLYSLFEDSDGNLLLNGLIGDTKGVMIKFDPFDLNILWSKMVINPSLKTYTIFESKDRLSYLLTGHAENCVYAFYSKVDKSTGDIYTLTHYKLDHCLGFYGGVEYNNSLFLCGRYSLGNRSDSYRPGISAVDLDGNEIWTKTYFSTSARDSRYYNFDMQVTSEGLLIAGTGNPNGTRLEDFVPHLYLINEQGDIQWSKTYSVNNGNRQFIYDIQAHSVGYYLIGDYNNINDQSSDLLVMNVDPSGGIIWSKRLSFKEYNKNTVQDINAKSQNATVIENDTLLLTINSGNSIFWTKIGQVGLTDKDCDLLQDVNVVVNSGSTFDADQSFVSSNRLHNSISDISASYDFTFQYEPLCGLPDITLRIDSSWCTSAPGFIAEAKIEVCNNGIVPYSGPIPISIYDNDPTRVYAQLVLKDTLNVTLPVDDCQYFTLPVLPRNITTGTFFVVINDDNSVTPLYDLNEDFPVTNIDECLFQNNLDSFFFTYSAKSIDLGPDISTCDNKPVTFNAGAGFDTYHWNDASTDSTITASTEGTYWVIAKDECGISYSDTVQLNYELPTKVHIGNDTILCFGDSITLNSTNTFMNYKWFPEEVFPCPSCPTVTLAPDSSITVIHTAESDPGCFSSDSIRIEVTIPFKINDSVKICKGDTISYFGLSISDTGRYSITLGQCDTIVNLYAQYEKGIYKEIDLGPDIFSCNDATVTFNAPSVFDSYQWNTNSSDSFITATEEGEYWVLAYDACGVAYSDTVKLKYESTQKVDLEDQRTICFGEPVDLNAPFGYSIYNWSPSELFECSTCQNTSITPDSTIKAHLFARTDSGCVSSDSITINVHYEHEIHDTLSFCQGDSIFYHNRFIDKPGIYQFTTGSYCDTTLVLQLYETDLSSILSTIDLSFTNGLQDLSGQTYDIDLNLDPDDWAVQWSPSVYFLCDTCLSTSIRPFEEERVLNLRLTHKSGCVYHKEFIVSWVEQNNIYIPNIFTPNGDGINDSWNIFTTNTVDNILSLQVYDRWGNLIREWKDRKNISWDGRFKGKELNSSVFIYIIEYRTAYGNNIRTSGDFTLLK